MSKLSNVKNEWTHILDFFTNESLLAVVIGIVVGKSFSDTVTSLINDIIYPCIDYFVVINMDDKYFVIKKGKNYPYKTQAAAKNDGAAVISWGNFSKSLINLLIHGIAVYYVIKFVTNINKKNKKNLQ